MFRKQKITGILNITDNYSSLLLSYMVPDFGAKTTLECLKQAFSFLPPPQVIVSDNASSLNVNFEVAKFFKSYGSTYIALTSPYNSRANKCEIRNQVFRNVLNMTSETFKRPICDIFHAALVMVNSRPLNITTHPHLRQIMDKDDQIITTYSLHYGVGDNIPKNKMLNMDECHQFL